MTASHRLAAAIGAAVTLLGIVASVPASSVPPTPVCLEPVLPCPAPTPDPATPDVTAYRGLGTWVDAYDFSREYSHRRVTPAAIDYMASQGVKTLYIQAAKKGRKSPGALLSPDLLGEFLERAHRKGMRVVAWYLPTFTDPNADWRHLDAILAFRSNGHRFDAVGVDIEARDVADHRTRSDRLVALSRRLREAAPAMALSAIVVPPVVTDVINPNFWPEFPWQDIKASYDVWIPMAYYTMRRSESPYRDAYRYVTENVRLLRENLDDPQAPVHVAGGIGDRSTGGDYDGLVRAAAETDSLGASSYDYATTAGSAWATLRRSPG